MKRAYYPDMKKLSEKRKAKLLTSLNSFEALLVYSNYKKNSKITNERKQITELIGKISN